MNKYMWLLHVRFMLVMVNHVIASKLQSNATQTKLREDLRNLLSILEQDKL